MPLRSSAPTVGAMIGNDLLDRAGALVVELRVKPHLQRDARQVAVLAELEGSDPTAAVERFLDDERAGGMTGGGTRPTVLRFTGDEIDRVAHTVDSETDALERERAERQLEVAGAVLVGLSARDRRIVRLRAQGWTTREIAVAIRLDHSSVCRRLAKIQAKSRALLNRAHHGG